MMKHSFISEYYNGFLDNLKKRVVSSRYKAAISVNKELILLYHHIGTEILNAQKIHGWGAKIIIYASRYTKPIRLAGYRLNEALPEEIKTNLPTIEQLEAELSKDLELTNE
jgi:hypothetical protein